MIISYHRTRKKEVQHTFKTMFLKTSDEAMAKILLGGWKRFLMFSQLLLILSYWGAKVFTTPLPMGFPKCYVFFDEPGCISWYFLFNKENATKKFHGFFVSQTQDVMILHRSAQPPKKAIRVPCPKLLKLKAKKTYLRVFRSFCMVKWLGLSMSTRVEVKLLVSKREKYREDILGVKDMYLRNHCIRQNKIWREECV